MRRIEENFDKEFWNGHVYRSKGYDGADDDRAQAMAVVSGLASKDKYPALTESLKKEYHASPYMEKYVLEALFMMGEDKFALKRIHDRYEKNDELQGLHYPFRGLGHRRRRLRWRHDKPCVERRTIDYAQPESMRYRADFSGIQDLPRSPADGRAEKRFG